MLHTVIPLELVTDASRSDLPQTVFIRRGGALVEAEGAAGDLRIRRLISTDPMLFLDGALAPGMPAGAKKDWN